MVFVLTLTVFNLTVILTITSLYRLAKAGVSLGVVGGGKEAEVAKVESMAAIVAAREAAEVGNKA